VVNLLVEVRLRDAVLSGVALKAVDQVRATAKVVGQGKAAAKVARVKTVARAQKSITDSLLL
jgi:hypothetical protein